MSGDETEIRRGERSRPSARPPGRQRDAFATPGRRARARLDLHQALEPVHLGQTAHGPRSRLLDRRRLRPLSPRPRRRRPLRLRLRRLRPARRDGGDRAQGAAGRVGRELRRADARADARLGFSFDYERVFYSSDEAQYRWSQWLFLTLLEAGLIYRDDTTVDWCDHCRTTLAALQVEDGRCWRCHNEVRLIRRPTWFLRITPYLEENDRRLEELEAGELGRDLALDPALHPRSQRRGGGRPRRPGRRGRSPPSRHTPRRSAQASFVLLSPAPPRAGELGRRPRPCASSSTSCARAAGSAAPATPSRCRWSTPAPRRARPGAAPSCRWSSRRWSTPATGRRRRSASPRSTRPTRDRRPRAAGRGGPRPRRAPAGREARVAVRYRAADFSISRQRFWGTPIPIVHCEGCGAVPVPEEDLPVVLPRDIEPTGEGNPLAERAEFVEVACPRCGEPARRETDTLDCHFDALWLWVPSAVPPEARAEEMFSHPDLQRWLPSGAPRRRRRLRRLRLRPARGHQGAARHRPVRLPRARASPSPAASSTRW